MSRITSYTIALICALALAGTAARAQTGARITFGINPTVFRAGQPANAELSVSSVSISPLTLTPGNVFSFFVDTSLGTVGSFTPLISVESNSLLPGDFSVSFGGNQNQINLTYNGQAKPFAYGDSLSVKVSLLASPHTGQGKLSLSSQFVSPVNGNLPFTAVSIVDFANSGTSAVVHDQTLIGDGTGPTPLGIALGGVNTANLANGAVTGLKIAPGAVNTTQLASGAVTGLNIANGSVVRNLNGLFDSVNLAAGPNVTVTPAGNTLTIAAPNLLGSVARDTTLTGNGTSVSPLGVASQGIGTAQLANNAVTTTQLADSSVTAGKIASGQVVKTLNGMTDNVVLGSDANILIVQGGNELLIEAPNMLTSIAHDASLTGNGTGASPLSVAATAAPTQQAVTFGTSFFLGNGGNECDAGCAQVYTVPQGQRLVIQQFMVTVDSVNSQQHISAFASIDFNAGVGSNPIFFPIILTEQALYAFGSAGTFSFGGSQPVTIYLNAGETVQFGGALTNGGGQIFYRCSFYGYLVPAP